MNVNVKSRYLTKTRFRLAVECPTKLYYTGKPTIYPDSKQKDDFLKALAEGGFQVGELAKLMYPGGVNITSLNHAVSLAETEALLSRDNVIIYEAAFLFEDLFVRVDILRKTGNRVELIEVKAKSFDSTDVYAFRKKTGSLDKNMLPYLQDVAFQRYVLAHSHPELNVEAFLMMADKSKTCSVDGLNQLFKIHRSKDGRSGVKVQEGTSALAIGSPVLTSVNVDEYVNQILTPFSIAPGLQSSLMEQAKAWAESYRSDQKIEPSVGDHCSKCEFRNDDRSNGKKSGFHECWLRAKGFTEAEMDFGTVLDVWNFKRKQELIDLGIVLKDKITKKHLNFKEADDGLSASQRQLMQVSNKWPGGGDFYLDRQLLKQEMSSWTYPLHFIDFETARVAIPFFKGQRPYDNIAFQFSHHVVDADGVVKHKNQYLSTEPGVKPNYEFVRQLKKAVGETGTVFMWWPHENSTLNAILVELEEDIDPPLDAADIKRTILDLTVLKRNGKVLRSGHRAMVDLCTLSSKVFFHPMTKASSSIKKVLPAVMQSSEYLKSKYSRPIYGNEGGVESLNFTDHCWWQSAPQGAQNPYQLLPPVFTDFPQSLLSDLQSADDMEIAEGGAATTAYARLQFDTLTTEERASISSALLRYCELDTMAMVMIYEAWREWL